MVITLTLKEPNFSAGGYGPLINCEIDKLTDTEWRPRSILKSLKVLSRFVVLFYDIIWRIDTYVKTLCFHSVSLPQF